MDNVDREFMEAVKRAGGPDAFSRLTGMGIVAITCAIDEIEARDPIKAICGFCQICKCGISSNDFADHTVKAEDGEILGYELAHIQCAITDNTHIGKAYWHWSL